MRRTQNDVSKLPKQKELMNTFKERFEQHPLQAALQGLWTTIREIKIPKVSLSDDAATQNNHLKRAAFARLIRVAVFITNSIKKSDYTIWSLNSLNEARTSVDTITAALHEFKSSQSVDGFEAAGDTSLDQFRKSFLSKFSTNLIFSLDGLTSFSEVAESSIRSAEELDRNIKAKEEEITVARDAFAKAIADLGAQIQSFNAQFEAQKTRIDEMVTTQQQSFQAGQTERTTSFSQETEGRKSANEQAFVVRSAAFDVWLVSANEKLDTILKATQDAASANLVEMENHQARAKEILGIVASSGVSGYYAKTATRELWSAEVLRGLALCCFVAMGLLIYHVVESLKGPDFRWEMGLFRVGVGLALSIPAFYCAKESGKHREAEKRNRRLQIELATIEPYLEKLHNPTEMQKILTEKANSYFMGHLPNEPNDDKDGDKVAKEARRYEDRFFDLMKTFLASVRR